LSNTNEKTTIPILQNFLEINKGWIAFDFPASDPSGAEQEPIETQKSYRNFTKINLFFVKRFRKQEKKFRVLKTV
jgi:hypothetical protein